MDVEQVIRGYFPQILHMSLATSKDNQPWVCEVHFVYDEDLNLYFRSLLSRRHSQEILSNPKVAGNIVTQHTITDKPRGVYFEGTAKVLSDIKEIEDAYKYFKERLNPGGREIIEQTKDKDGNQFFKISVDTYYLFDSRESSPSQKYELKWGRNKS